MQQIKNYPIHFYSTELFIRFIYSILSFSFCFLIIFLNDKLIFLFEVYPVIKFSHRLFLATKVTDLFNSLWLLSFSFSHLAMFPLVSFHFSFFFSTSWYKYQIELFYRIISIFWVSFVSFFIGIHYLLFPSLLKFLFQWETNNFLFSIDAESRIYSYLIWVLYLNFFSSFFFSLFLLVLILFFLFTKVDKLYKFIKSKKSFIIFFIILSSFIFLPYSNEILFHFVFICIIFILYELIFFLLCIKIFWLNYYKYANYSTITKKTSKKLL